MRLKLLATVLLGSFLALPVSSVYASQRSDTAWQKVESGALLIDVRTPGEFAQGHLDNAINIPLENVETGFKDIAKDQPIVVYCRSGNRSGIAMKSLIKQGYINVHNGGGLSEMQEAQMNVAPLN